MKKSFAPNLRPLAASLATLLLATSAPAHQMWIETLTDPPRTVVRFGEFGDTVEKSPGYLDQLAPVLAWVPASVNPARADAISPGASGASAASAASSPAAQEPLVLVSSKKADHFLLEAQPAAAASSPDNPSAAAAPADSSKTPPTVLAQTGFPVMGKEGAPSRLPLFYLRSHAAGPETAATMPSPAMTLDLVPEGKNVVRVFFRAQPFAHCELTLMTEGRETTLTADAEGRVTLPACPAGPALLTANRKEDLAGIHLGKPYSITSHNASLSWVAK